MRSKRYSSIVGSSFSLLLISCFAPQSDFKNDKRDEKKGDEVKYDLIPGEDDMGEPPPEPPEPGDSGDSGEGDSAGPEVGVGPKFGAGHLSVRPTSKDGCHKGSMRFEGKCMDKEHVGEILDGRDKGIKAKVHNATNPKQQADAAYEFLEQEIAQMDKTEDDLDELIEQLKEQEIAKELDGLPDKNEDNP